MQERLIRVLAFGTIHPDSLCNIVAACTAWGGTCQTNANGMFCRCGWWQPIACYHD
jgi:hypothetical protein